MPPTYLLVALAAVACLHLLVPGPRPIGSPWRYFGLLPLGFGVWLNFWADRLFKMRGAEVKPGHESATLVTDGPYRVTRNPMYLGMVLIVLGAAFVAGSTSPFVVVVGLWWLLRTHFVIPEETMLRRRFGDEFERYARRVRRWLGRRVC